MRARHVRVPLAALALSLLGSATALADKGGDLDLNAFHHAGSGSRTEIAVADCGTEVQITVADTGPGVDPADAELIFESFYRADRTRGGTGLGLAIAKRAILLHGGKIWLENRTGGGAVFHFRIPKDCRARPGLAA